MAGPHQHLIIGKYARRGISSLLFLVRHADFVVRDGVCRADSRDILAVWLRPLSRFCRAFRAIVNRRHGDQSSFAGAMWNEVGLERGRQAIGPSCDSCLVGRLNGSFAAIRGYDCCVLFGGYVQCYLLG